MTTSTPSSGTSRPTSSALRRRRPHSARCGVWRRRIASDRCWTSSHSSGSLAAMEDPRSLERLSRRALLRAGVSAAAGGLILGRWPVAIAAESDPLHAGRRLVSFPGKTDLILLATRPPELETPMTYFDRPI